MSGVDLEEMRRAREERQRRIKENSEKAAQAKEKREKEKAQAGKSMAVSLKDLLSASDSDSDEDSTDKGSPEPSSGPSPTSTTPNQFSSVTQAATITTPQVGNPTGPPTQATTNLHIDAPTLVQPSIVQPPQPQVGSHSVAPQVTGPATIGRHGVLTEQPIAFQAPRRKSTDSTASMDY